MNSLRFPSPARLLISGLLMISPLPAGEIECSHGALRPPPQAMPGSGVRRYAADRRADLLNLVLDVTPDFKERSISGTATLTFKPVGKPMEELVLDGIDLKVSAVESSATLKGHQATKEAVILTFESPLAVGVEETVTIHYSATPKDGLYFRTPEQGYKEGETHVYSQGETILARNWFPVIDSPAEKLTTEVICHLPDGMSAWSNGRLVSTRKDPATGLTAYDWKQEKPHSAYLVSLVAGQFVSIEDRYKDLPMAFIVPPSDAAMAKRSFEGTKEMLEFFEGELGFPFPWAKYDQIVVRDFQWGGMENTSISTLTDRLLATDDYENLHTSTSIVAHELAHQWFGDVVTCKDWSTLWLNEGFATYYDALFQEHLYGREQFLYDRGKVARGLIGQNNPRPIVFRQINADGFDQFGSLSYAKGSWVLHMLRSELGPELYRKVIQTYLQRHQFRAVVTPDLVSVLEEVTGRSWDRFFDQWVYHGGYPSLAADYSWDEKTGLATIHLSQKQKISDDVLQFHLPVTVRFKGDFGTIDKVFQLEELSQEFTAALPGAPKIVRVDPEVALLAKIDFTPTRAMLEAQLTDKEDAIGRVQALEQIEEEEGPSGVARIRDILEQDPQWFVRVEAADALARIDSDEAFKALTASPPQSDARVRRAVVEAIGSYVRPKALEILLERLATEKNPEIKESIVRTLANHHEDRAHDELKRQLESQSLRNHLFDAAVEGIRDSDDDSFIAPLFQAIRSRQDELESRSLDRAMSALAYLSRDKEDKTEVFEFLVSQLDARRDQVAKGAAGALGELKDKRARPILTALSKKPGQEAAKDALKALDDPKDEEISRLKERVEELEHSPKAVGKPRGSAELPRWVQLLNATLGLLCLPLLLVVLWRTRRAQQAAISRLAEPTDSE